MRRLCKWHREGDQRIITKFLFLPTAAENADGVREMRWMERATVLQRFKYGGWVGGADWNNMKWMKEQPDAELRNYWEQSDEKDTA